jgi:hypothetical protein
LSWSSQTTRTGGRILCPRACIFLCFFVNGSVTTQLFKTLLPLPNALQFQYQPASQPLYILLHIFFHGSTHCQEYTNVAHLTIFKLGINPLNTLFQYSTSSKLLLFYCFFPPFNTIIELELEDWCDWLTILDHLIWLHVNFWWKFIGTTQINLVKKH